MKNTDAYNALQTAISSYFLSEVRKDYLDKNGVNYEVVGYDENGTTIIRVEGETLTILSDAK